MLDTAIGPIVRVLENNTFQMQVTHVGTQNKYSYNTFEIVVIAPKPITPHTTFLSHTLVGRRVKCSVHYRDKFNRLYADVVFDNA